VPLPEIVRQPQRLTADCADATVIPTVYETSTARVQGFVVYCKGVIPGR
jgi:hypothetical protein